MIHAFTCAEILPSQYAHFSAFSGLGTVGHNYIRKSSLLILSIFTVLHYLACSVQATWQSCMVAAVEEVKKLPFYETSKGEVM